MHYGKFAFSKNGKQTLKAIGSDRALGSSTTLGASDIVAINALYDCASTYIVAHNVRCFFQVFVSRLLLTE